MIGIIGAMDEEIEVLVNELVMIEEIVEANYVFYTGKLHDKDVVIVKSGIGKVNAAVCTTLLIKNFNVEVIYFSGVGGGLTNDLSIGDVVVSTFVLHHDFDATAFGYKLGEIPRDNTSKYESMSINLDIKKGVIVSGDKFVNNIDEKLYLANTFNAICVDMESAGVAQVCSKFNIPFLIIRSISDTINETATIEYNKFISIACDNSKNMILTLLKIV